MRRLGFFTALGVSLLSRGVLSGDLPLDTTIELIDKEENTPSESVLETLLAPDDFPERRFVHESFGDEAAYSLDVSLGADPPMAELHPERLPWPGVAGLELRAVNPPLSLKKARPSVTDDDLDAGFSVQWILKPLGQRFRPRPHFAVQVLRAEVLASRDKTPLLLWKAPPPREICPRNIKKGRPDCDLNTISREVRGIAASPDGSLAALALGGLKPRIEIYDIENTPRLKWQSLLSSGSGGAVEIAFSTDGKWVAALTGQGKMHRFEALTGGRHMAIPSSGKAARSIPPGDIIAVAGEQGAVTFWILKDGTIAWRLPPRGMRGTVDRLSASADGMRFATLEYSDNNVFVRVWEMHRRAMLVEIAVEPYSISDIALDEHGNNVFLVHEKKGLLKCPVAKSAKPAPFAGEVGARCGSRLRWLAPLSYISCSVPDGELQIDRDGNLVSELKTGLVSSDWQLAASADGTRLVAAGSGHLLLWRLNKRKESRERRFQR